MNEPVVVGLDIRHNCYCSDIPEKIADTRLRYITYAGSDKENSRNLMGIQSSDIERAIGEIRKHPVVSGVEILRKGKNSADAYVSSKKDEATVEALIRSKSAFFGQGIYEDGLEKISVLCPNFRAFRKFTSQLDSGFEYKVRFKKFIKPDESIKVDFFRSDAFPDLQHVCSLITERQLGVFDYACKKGYYENPRRITLAEIAREFEISESTASELIRKVERRLLPSLSLIIKMLK